MRLVCWHQLQVCIFWWQKLILLLILINSDNYRKLMIFFFLLNIQYVTSNFIILYSIAIFYNITELVKNCIFKNIIISLANSNYFLLQIASSWIQLIGWSSWHLVVIRCLSWRILLKELWVFNLYCLQVFVADMTD